MDDIVLFQIQGHARLNGHDPEIVPAEITFFGDISAGGLSMSGT